MIGKKVVHHLMMSAKDAHYVGGLVNGARIVDQWGDVGTELMAPVCGIICGGLGYFRLKKSNGELKSDEVRKWRMISVVEMILGILTAFPCMILFLGACSGQI